MESQYNSLSEWRKADKKAYTSAYGRGMLNDICDMFGWDKTKDRNPNGYWTKERCIESAKQFNTKSEWKRSCVSSYGAAKTNKWFDECCVHMVTKLTKPSGYWTKERCIESAKHFNTRKGWERGCGSSYGAARTNKWLDECCTHMVRGRKPNGYWTKERCVESAKGFNSRSEWRMGCGSSYGVALKNKWLDECCVHMVSGYKRKKK